jgi:hypothetical protein
MTPGERLKAQTRLNLEQAERSSRARARQEAREEEKEGGAARPWTRYEQVQGVRGPASVWVVATNNNFTL